MSCNEEKIDFKEEIEKLLKYLNHSNKLYGNKVRDVNNLLKLACEEQKKLCAKNAYICLRKYPTIGKAVEENYGKEVSTEVENEYWGIKQDSILNAPTVKFD